MRQRDLTVFHIHVFLDHFGIHVVELIPYGQGRIGDTGHLRSVFSDEIGNVGNVQTLLEHEVGPFEVGRVYVHLREPRIVAVEFVAEPCIHTRQTIVRLRDIYMQQGIVDTLSEEAVAALLDDTRIAGIGISGAGIRFCRDSPFSINMTARGSCAVLDIAEFAFAPELTSDFIGLSAIHQELSGESPVTVVLEPCMQTVFVADIA